MKLVDPSYTIVLQDSTKMTFNELFDEMKKHVEWIGRICYKSEDNITEDSRHAFYERLIKSKHFAVIEHATIYLAIPRRGTITDKDMFEYIVDEKCMRSNQVKPFILTQDKNFYYISTNLAYIVYLGILDNSGIFMEEIQNYVVPFNPGYHEIRPTVNFVTSLQVTTDLVRHRKMSYAMESTRYCNYTKGKFGEELTFVTLPWLDLKPGKYTKNDMMHYSGSNALYLKSCFEDEDNYLSAVNGFGWQAQQASSFLPKTTKTEIVITGFLSDWAHIFDQRSSHCITGVPRVEILNLYNPLVEDFMNMFFNNYIENRWAFRNKAHDSYRTISEFLYNRDKKLQTEDYKELYNDKYYPL